MFTKLMSSLNAWLQAVSRFQLRICKLADQAVSPFSRKILKTDGWSRGPCSRIHLRACGKIWHNRGAWNTKREQTEQFRKHQEGKRQNVWLSNCKRARTAASAASSAVMCACLACLCAPEYTLDRWFLKLYTDSNVNIRDKNTKEILGTA